VTAVALDAHAREDQPALRVDVLRERHVGGGLVVAGVGLVRLRHRREQVLALLEHGHEHDVVGRVRVAEVRIVVEVRVPVSDVVVMVGHRRAEERRAEDVNRQPLGRRQQLVVAGHDRATEVARHVDHAASARPQERVLHLAHDPVQAVRDHGEQDRVERGAHGRPSSVSRSIR
jgi:hypothetical protein